MQRLPGWILAVLSRFRFSFILLLIESSHCTQGEWYESIFKTGQYSQYPAGKPLGYLSTFGLISRKNDRFELHKKVKYHCPSEYCAQKKNTFLTLNYECLWKYVDLSSITIKFQLWWLEPWGIAPSDNSSVSTELGGVSWLRDRLVLIWPIWTNFLFRVSHLNCLAVLSIYGGSLWRASCSSRSVFVSRPHEVR